jgi:hypothetical protein
MLVFLGVFLSTLISLYQKLNQLCYCERTIRRYKEALYGPDCLVFITRQDTYSLQAFYSPQYRVDIPSFPHTVFCSCIFLLLPSHNLCMDQLLFHKQCKIQYFKLRTWPQTTSVSGIMAGLIRYTYDMIHS